MTSGVDEIAYLGSQLNHTEEYTDSLNEYILTLKDVISSQDELILNYETQLKVYNKPPLISRVIKWVRRTRNE